jgi:lipopolysaccharide export LptBFGC system permease protein LptF
MMRVLQIVVVLAVVFSVAYVLITPDPTDDVDGILLSNHPLTAHRLIGVSVPHFQMFTIVLARLSTVLTFSKFSTTSELLALTCVCRC